MKQIKTSFLKEIIKLAEKYNVEVNRYENDPIDGIKINFRIVYTKGETNETKSDDDKTK